VSLLRLLLLLQLLSLLLLLLQMQVVLPLVPLLVGEGLVIHEDHCWPPLLLLLLPARQQVILTMVPRRGNQPRGQHSPHLVSCQGHRSAQLAAHCCQYCSRLVFHGHHWRHGGEVQGQHVHFLPQLQPRPWSCCGRLSNSQR
jgi:hypothetical protein